jgi:hypothetical protein
VRLLLLAFVASCYSPGYADCEVACAGQSCPDGLTCLEGRCRTGGMTGTCSGGSNVDAATCSLDLDTDSDHCGRCDRACMIGSCSGGVCMPHTVAMDIPLPGFMAAGNGYFAYSSGLYGNCPAASYVAIANSADLNTTRIPSANRCATQLQMVAGALYVAWFGHVNGYSVPSGNPFQQVTTVGGYVGGLAVTPNEIYLGDGDPDYAMWKTDVQLGAAAKIFMRQGWKIYDIAVAKGGGLLWLGGRDDAAGGVRHIARVEPDGSNLVEETMSAGGLVLGVGGGRVFYGEVVAPARLLSFPETGGQPTVLTMGFSITALTADDSGVYWAEQVNPTMTTIHARHHDTGKNEILATESEGVVAMAIDGPWLYWLTSNATTMTGHVARTAK